ncbi:MAG: DUF6268 family outer membrane beta-barrel protein [Prevotellaceae bacterium]|nr:DUF6268 family outer membrane beta-barrel protein [Prevotellaceae bacterium]
MKAILRKNSLILLFSAFLINAQLYGQIQIESSYMLSSNHRDATNTKTGGRGDFKDASLFVQAPVYMKTNELNQITAWAIAINATYASMDNTGLSDDQCLSQLLNSSLGVAHMRPLNAKWMFTTSLGAGIYTDLSQFYANSIMAQAGALFIRRMSPNFDIGFGAALNNVLGYPMIFPSVYLDWKTGEQFEFKISLYDTWLVSAGMKINDTYTVRLMAQAKGMTAVVDRNNVSKIFSKQLVIIGLQPEIYVSKMFSIPITAGVAVIREAYFQDRTLRAFFDIQENYPHFAPSLYISAGLKFFFNE